MTGRGKCFAAANSRKSGPWRSCPEVSHDMLHSCRPPVILRPVNVVRVQTEKILACCVRLQDDEKRLRYC